VPDPNHPNCGSCNAIANDGFESGFGNWNDGGNDCARVTLNPNTGSYSIRLRDNSGNSSSMFSDAFDLSSYAEANINFSFYTESMENGEDFFLEYSTDNGANYFNYQSWVSGTDFQNTVRINESVLVTGISLSSTTRFRFRCDASNNGDRIYIDDVVIEGCGSASNRETGEPDSEEENQDRELDLIAFPNPTEGILNIDLSQVKGQAATIHIYDFAGKLIYNHDIPSKHGDIVEIELGNLNNGLYLIKVESGKVSYKLKRVVYLRN